MRSGEDKRYSENTQNLHNTARQNFGADFGEVQLRSEKFIADNLQHRQPDKQVQYVENNNLDLPPLSKDNSEYYNRETELAYTQAVDTGVSTLNRAGKDSNVYSAYGDVAPGSVYYGREQVMQVQQAGGMPAQAQPTGRNMNSAAYAAGRTATGANPVQVQDFGVHDEKYSAVMANLSPEELEQANRLANNLEKSMRKRVKGKPVRSVYSLPFFSALSKGVFRVFKLALILIVAFVIFTGAIGLGMVTGYVASTEPISAALLARGAQTSYFYDKDGKEIGKQTGSQNIDRDYISLDEVKDTYIMKAFIAIEDQRFETNIGIDPRRILSAVAGFVLNSDNAHGGSTIAQQTVKLLTGDDQTSAQRKVQEWYRAIKLTQQLGKSQIMENYLNLVPMANSYVGVQSAAKAYFNKDAKDLNLAECAFLAGIPKSPATYNPLRESGKRNALRRQRQVLLKMYEQGFITDQEYQDALNTELLFNVEQSSSYEQKINTYYIEYTQQQVVRALQREKGYSLELANRLVGSGGLRIYTNFDPKIQRDIDVSFNTESLFQKNPAVFVNEPEKPQAGMAIIEVGTGKIVGLAGGYGEKTGNLYLNRATDIRRQPGSSIKPVGVYAPAIEENLITGATIEVDEPVFLDPDNPTSEWPSNVDKRHVGPMTVRHALKQSNNVVAVKLLQQLTVPKAKEYLRMNGVALKDDQSWLSLALGALTYGVSPLEMATSYQTLANGGIYVEPTTFTKIEDAQGNVVLEVIPEKHQVFSEATSFMITKMLEGYFQGASSANDTSGLAFLWNVTGIKNAQGQAIPVAAKTGTTDSIVDRWFCGYTPYYAAATWYGFDNRLKTTEISEADNGNVVYIWQDVMQRIHSDKQPSQWVQPGNVVAHDVSTLTGKLANEAEYAANLVEREYFVKGSALEPLSVSSAADLVPYMNADGVFPGGIWFGYDEDGNLISLDQSEMNDYEYIIEDGQVKRVPKKKKVSGDAADDYTVDPFTGRIIYNTEPTEEGNKPRPVQPDSAGGNRTWRVFG